MVSTNDLDGENVSGGDKGLFGSRAETYMTFNLGLQWYFSKGEPSQYCEKYTGISTEVPKGITTEEVESIVKKHIPKEIIKEVVVEKPVVVKKDRWVLVGVNFDFNKTTLKSESYIILFHSVLMLEENPDMVVEIGGHTDNIGSEEVNMKLSNRRAQVVKDYLVSKGIDTNRLKVKGYGELMPITDNSTPEGRALNRRIEFKILSE
jgi:OOP family OmpA-OmpF porin